MGVLIEHYAGRFPVWLSPVQVLILTITDEQDAYAAELRDMLRETDIRVEVDGRNEKLGLKIREGTLRKIPYLIIIGKKEVESRTISVQKPRRRGDERRHAFGVCRESKGRKYVQEVSLIGSSARDVKDVTNINEKIRAKEVRLIDENGAMVGVVPTYDAIRMARERELDLVEVSPKAVPPVARIMDYGKFKYETAKEGAGGQEETDRHSGERDEAGAQDRGTRPSVQAQAPAWVSRRGRQDKD